MIADIVMAVVLAFTAQRFLAVVWTIPVLLVKGPTIVRALREAGALETTNFAAALNPVDRLLEHLAGSSALRRRLLPAFAVPGAVTAGAVGALILHADPGLRLALSLVTAGTVLGILLIAVLRRLILGDDEWRTSDLDPKRYPIPADWALCADRQAKRSIYLLALIYVQILGFAALYAGIAAVDDQAFELGGTARSGLTWLYLSATTLATVGYGDVHAKSVGAEAAAVAQIATGPLILTWLFANLRGGDTDAGAAPVDEPAAP